MMKNTILTLTAILCMSFNYSLSAHTVNGSKRQKTKVSIPSEIQSQIDKMTKQEIKIQGGKKIGSVPMNIFKPLGSVTTKELKSLKKSFETLTPPHNNFKNNMGLIRRYIDVLDMAYEISGDVWFLDKMIECCDHMIDGQNGPGKYKSLTGNYDYFWPTKFRYKDNEIVVNMALFSNGIIVKRISRVAEIILDNPQIKDKETPVRDEFNFGKTYEERALVYLDRATKTMDFLVDLCYEKESGLMVYPEEYKWSDRPDFVGIAPAWNRYFMQGVGLMQTAITLQKIGKSPKKVKLYHQITQKMVNEFFTTVKRSTKNEKPVYWWPYNYYFSPNRAEDAHAWFDIDLMVQFYRSEQYQITSDMMTPFANTYLEVMYQGEGKLSSNIDGSGKIKATQGGIAWLHLLEFRPEIYEIMTTHYMSRVKMNGREFGELLYAKYLMNKLHPNYQWKDLVDPTMLKNKKASKRKTSSKRKKS